MQFYVLFPWASPINCTQGTNHIHPCHGTTIGTQYLYFCIGTPSCSNAGIVYNPDERPPFSDLIRSISGFAEMTAGYLDMNNYNPFANEVSSSDHVSLRTTEGGDYEVRSKGRHSSQGDVPTDDPPVIINVPF